MLPAPHSGDQDEPEMRLEGEAEVTQGESGIRGTEVCSPSLGFNPSQETLLTDKDMECQELCVGRRSVHMLDQPFYIQNILLLYKIFPFLWEECFTAQDKNN